MSGTALRPEPIRRTLEVPFPPQGEQIELFSRTNRECGELFEPEFIGFLVAGEDFEDLEEAFDAWLDAGREEDFHALYRVETGETTDFVRRYDPKRGWQKLENR